MKVINMTNVVVWTSQHDFQNPSVYKTEGGVIVDTRNNRIVGNLVEFLHRRADTIVVVTREVAATIDSELLGQVRVPGQAEMLGGGYYAEMYNPHAHH